MNSDAGQHSITETTFQEKTISVTLQMPIKSLKLKLPYISPYECAQWIKTQVENLKQRLKGGKDISEAQVDLLNHHMATSLENMIAVFKEQVCLPLQISPEDPKDIKLFKLRANKDVIRVLEDINKWLIVSLEKVSVPNQPIDEKVKEYDGIIRDLKKKIKLLRIDNMSLEVHDLDDDKLAKGDNFSKDDKREEKSGNDKTPQLLSKDQPSSMDKQTEEKRKIKPDDPKKDKKFKGPDKECLKIS